MKNFTAFTGIILLCASSSHAGDTPDKADATLVNLNRAIPLMDRDGKPYTLASDRGTYPGINSSAQLRVSFDETNDAGNNLLQFKIREPDTQRIEFNLGKEVTYRDLANLTVAPADTGQNVGLQFSQLPQRAPEVSYEYTPAHDECHWVPGPHGHDHEVCHFYPARCRQITTTFADYQVAMTDVQGAALGQIQYDYQDSYSELVSLAYCR